MMEEEKRIFESKNGPLDARYSNAGAGTPLIIIANGHNGFFNYGMFPFIRNYLREQGISAIGFNYSHSGIEGESDVFKDLERYRKNCRRLEKEDLLTVLGSASEQFPQHPKVFILAHSMGGIATVFAAQEAAENGIPLHGAILLNCLSTLNVRSESVIENWKKNGVWLLRNNRTLQDLPQGEEYLQETLGSAGNGPWNPKSTVHSLRIPLLILHGDEDESVPVWHSEHLYAWSKEQHPDTRFELIAGGTHTLNTKHPFAGATPQLIAALGKIKQWLR
jgi:alpha-beta hydrolase superfamily lysophospholipase